MPIYEFKCSNCGQIFEELRSIDNRDDKTECPLCRSGTERIVSCCAPTPGNESSLGNSACGSGRFS